MPAFNRSTPVLLGIDLGTSSMKCLAVDPDGNILALASQEYPISIPQPGWAEQDPQDWIDACLHTLQECWHTGDFSPAQIAGIGLSGQMHGLVVLDETLQPLRPAVIWADQRSQKQVDWIENRIGKENLRDWTGNPVATGFMLPSWLWLCENERDLALRARQLLLPKDYLRLVLTGLTGSEPSDASSTLLFNPALRTWSLPLLDALEIDPRLLPSLGESAQIAGFLRPAIADLLRIPAGIPIVHGGSDQALQALGHGVIHPGEVSSTIGTGGQLFTPVVQPDPDPELRLHLFCHAAPDVWHLEAATLSAGLAFRWLRDRILEGKSYGSLANLALQSPPGSKGLIFLPYLAGERTPWMDPQARGALIGLSLQHGPEDVVRAVMEGVVFALRQGLEIMQMMGVPVEKIIASGGAVQHPLWLQLQADIYQHPIFRTQTVEASALGAALLAGVGVGLYPDIQSACHTAVHLLPEIVYPHPDNVGDYAQAYRRYTRAYPLLKSVH